MSMVQKYMEIRRMIINDELEDDVRRAEEKGNHAASVRMRKILMEISRRCVMLRQQSVVIGKNLKKEKQDE